MTVPAISAHLAILREAISEPLPFTLLITGQLDGQILGKFLSAFEASPESMSDETFAEFVKRHVFHASSSRGRFLNARAAMSHTALHAERYCSQTEVRSSLRLQAAAIRGALETCAVFWRNVKQLRGPLARVAKHSRNLNFSTLSEACRALEGISVELPTLGLIDLLELGKSGTLQFAQKRKFFADPRELKSIRDAVTKLNEVDYDADLDYAFLSELIHPAGASLLDVFSSPNLVSSRGLHFRQHLVRSADNPFARVESPHMQPTLDSALLRVLATAARLTAESAEVSAACLSLVQRYFAMAIGSIRTFRPSAAKCLLDSLNLHAYELCPCLSGNGFKHCCRAAVTAAVRAK